MKLNWIDPMGSRKIKIHRCEFCGKDVSTPYKGVHDEIEIFNGFPVKCRNNGRLNGHIAYGYPVEDKPHPLIKYYVEHKGSHMWWTGYNWSHNKEEAFGCELRWVADRYARFKGLTNYIITEHILSHESPSEPVSAPICSCGGGENNGHSWNCPWYNENDT